MCNAKWALHIENDFAKHGADETTGILFFYTTTAKRELDLRGVCPFTYHKNHPQPPFALQVRPPFFSCTKTTIQNKK